MNLDSIIRACQRLSYATEDGKPGIETWTKIYAKLAGSPWPEFIDTEEMVDARSEDAIETLLMEVRPYARALLHRAAKAGLTFVITSGTRTYDEQDKLYAIGRTKPGKIKTNARGGYSNHNFGLAFDCTLFSGRAPVYESPNYKALGAMGMELGLEWGGNWRSIEDEPHFQLRPEWATEMKESTMLAELRKRADSGEPVFT